MSRSKNPSTYDIVAAAKAAGVSPATIRGRAHAEWKRYAVGLPAKPSASQQRRERALHAAFAAANTAYSRWAKANRKGKVSKDGSVATATGGGILVTARVTRGDDRGMAQADPEAKATEAPAPPPAPGPDAAELARRAHDSALAEALDVYRELAELSPEARRILTKLVDRLPVSKGKVGV